MERQHAFTILGSAGAAAAATAALLFLWLPATPQPEPAPEQGSVAALRREIETLRSELAARPLPLPPPVVAERVVDVAAGRARDDLEDRCDALVARCDELERNVAELSNRLTLTTFDPANGILLAPTGDEDSGNGAGGRPRYGLIQEGEVPARSNFFDAVRRLEQVPVKISAQTIHFPDRM
jgi:hypothetical protein